MLARENWNRVTGDTIARRVVKRSEVAEIVDQLLMDAGYRVKSDVFTTDGADMRVEFVLGARKYVVNVAYFCNNGFISGYIMALVAVGDEVLARWDGKNNLLAAITWLIGQDRQAIALQFGPAKPQAQRHPLWNVLR